MRVLIAGVNFQANCPCWWPAVSVILNNKVAALGRLGLLIYFDGKQNKLARTVHNGEVSSLGICQYRGISFYMIACFYLLVTPLYWRNWIKKNKTVLAHHSYMTLIFLGRISMNCFFWCKGNFQVLLFMLACVLTWLCDGRLEYTGAIS